MLPRVETAERQPREMIMHVWVNHDGNISINDKIVNVDKIEDIMTRCCRSAPI